MLPKVWLRLSSVPKWARTIDEKRKTFPINALHGVGLTFAVFAAVVDHFHPGRAPPLLGYMSIIFHFALKSIHMARQHECAMSKLSAKQPPSILPFISLVARHMAGSPGGTLYSLLKSYHQRPKNRCCRSHSVYSTPAIFISLTEVLEWILLQDRVHHVVHYLYNILLLRLTASP